MRCCRRASGPIPRVALAVFVGIGAFAAKALAQTSYQPATLINPANGATDVELTQPFTWTGVTGVQAYYLYVGTSLGAKDVVNTGEIQQTSYLIPGPAPVNQTLYARLWTKAGGVWRYVDSTFSTSAIARFTAPAAGATTVDPTQALTWTAVNGAQAYYLYVGTTLGAKDLIDTGEIQQTSYWISSTLAPNQTVYARLWTKAGGVWRFTDRAFSLPPIIALFTYPAGGATTIDLTHALTWAAVPGAQAYYLYVGSSLGAKDLIDTGEIQQTSYFIRGTRPANQILYARLWTKMAGAWRYVDRWFTAAFATPLAFTYPVAGVTAADMRQPFQWAPVASAQAYYLYVGRILGQRDLVDTGEIQTTSYPAANLPLNRQLYVRLWVKEANVWSYIDRFITALAPGATTIGFDALTGDRSNLTTYAESGFTVSAASGGWLARTIFGHPAPYIELSVPGGSTVTGEVRVSAAGAVFSFNAVDLYSSTTPIPYLIAGLRNGSTVFTVLGTLPNTFGNFVTVANPFAAALIDTLSITLTNAAAACCWNPMGMDNIVVAR